MGDKKAYRLMKHLPDSCAGDIYYFDADERVYYKHGNKDDSYWQQHIVESNSEWFQPFGEQKEEVFVDREPYDKFESGVETLINKNSLENASDTPDYISAEFLRKVFELFNKSIRQRTEWFNVPADKAKSFTEEDMRQCFEAGMVNENKRLNYNKYLNVDQYLNSLSPASKKIR